METEPAAYFICLILYISDPLGQQIRKNQKVKPLLSISYNLYILRVDKSGASELESGWAIRKLAVLALNATLRILQSMHAKA